MSRAARSAEAQHAQAQPASTRVDPARRVHDRAPADRLVAAPRDARTPSRAIEPDSTPLAREQLAEQPATLTNALAQTSPQHTLSSTPISEPIMPPPEPTYDPTDLYAPLLRCPACSPAALLISPTTLHCGHTVCSAHVRDDRPSSPPAEPVPVATASSSRIPPPSRSRAAGDGSASATAPVIPSCPLPTCRPVPYQQVVAPNIPPGSSVAYYPPLISPMNTSGAVEPARVTVPDPRIDVSVSRALDLLESAREWKVGNEDAVQNSSASDSGSSDESGDDDERDPHREGDILESSRHDSSTVERRRRPNRSSHPRKRRRAEAKARRHFESSEQLEDHFNKELSESLTCEICFMLLYQPVTTPCQHTFCAKCLQRSLDHGSKCPLCRQAMPPFSYFQDHPFNKVILAILLKAFPEMYAERGQAIADEERNARLDTPIFVCQLSFPGLPTVLHFFEPRYRLMLRRCLESTNPEFGMITPARTLNSSGNEYGTMLRIRSVQMLPDGRSMVETWGTHRFRILESGTLDGYMIGRIESVDDIPEEVEEEAENSLLSVRRDRTDPPEGSSAPATPARATSLQPTTEELIAVCHAFVEQLRNGTAPWVVQRLNNTFGPMPTDTSHFTFWMAQVLPIDEHEKAKLLVIRTARRRLQLVVHWIEQLNSNWWFSSGCTIA